MMAEREDFEKRLIKGLGSYYDVELTGEDNRPLIATAFFHVHSASYVVLKSAEIWSADCDEYIYLFSMPRLTKELYEECLKMACDDGIPRIKPGSHHMASYVSAVFLCDAWDTEALKALKKCRIRKSFHFSLHGWMEVQTAAVLVGKKTVEANYPSCDTAKYLKSFFGNGKRNRFKMFLKILKD